MTDLKEIIKKRLELEAIAKNYESLLPEWFWGKLAPGECFAKRVTYEQFIAQSYTEYRPTQEALLLAIDALEEIIEVSGISTIHYKIARDTHEKIKELVR